MIQFICWLGRSLVSFLPIFHLRIFFFPENRDFLLRHSPNKLYGRNKFFIYACGGVWFMPTSCNVWHHFFVSALLSNKAKKGISSNMLDTNQKGILCKTFKARHFLDANQRNKFKRFGCTSRLCSTLWIRIKALFSNILDANQHILFKHFGWKATNSFKHLGYESEAVGSIDMNAQQGFVLTVWMRKKDC